MPIVRNLTIFFAVIFISTAMRGATVLDTIGVTLLRATNPDLIGSGVKVAQTEAKDGNGAWQVNPFAVGQPTNLFTYVSSEGTSSNYPNTLGSPSGHANGVAGNSYGIPWGVSPGVSHVDNFEADHFYKSIIVPGLAIQSKIVNQSFIFTGGDPSQSTIDSLYDNYAAQHNTLFVSGIGNSGAPSPPATAYNGIGVAAFGGNSSIGPTSGNGRSKPDITAPAGVTSFSTPLVAGAAAILLQAGLRGDGGAGTTNAAADIRTLKALLLNGAVKPSNWTHTSSSPLDARFGSGILNVFNSYQQLVAGKHSFIESTTTSSGGEHPPGNNSTNIASMGWDFNSISSQILQDRINHYYFDLPATTANSFTHTATLVWNRAVGQSSARNLDLFLYDTSNNSLVASSISTVDNVEHVFVSNLPAGRYDLQVLKKAGLGSETYALAFESFATTLDIARTGENVTISWPIAPTGFKLQSASSLNAPISWTTLTDVPTNSQNSVTIPATESLQFFRLIRP